MEDNERAGYIATIVLLTMIILIYSYVILTHPHIITTTEILSSKI